MPKTKVYSLVLQIQKEFEVTPKKFDKIVETMQKFFEEQGWSCNVESAEEVEEDDGISE